jgi:hypothetical protein
MQKIFPFRFECSLFLPTHEIVRRYITMKEQRQRAADWHGIQAVKAYRRRDYEAYVRHARIADQLWQEGK